MIPLLLAKQDEEHTILRVSGNPEVKKHLSNLGFIAGEKVSVVSSIDGNLIVHIMDARIALSKELAQKIMV